MVQILSDYRFAPAAGGSTLAWREAGEGDLLLLVSGQAVDSTAWDAVVPAFAERFRVITFDHRGTGRSSAGEDDRFTTRLFAADAITVLNAAGVRRAHVYGHSMGGRVAQWIAIDHPDRVGALVLGATTGGDARGVPRSESASADLSSGDPDRLARLFFTDGHRRAAAAAIFAPTASRQARRLHFAASRAHDTWDELAAITAPTLVMHGADDEVTPPGNAKMLAAAIDGAQLQLLAGARHGYYLEHPDATARVIDFLQQHPLDAQAE